MCLVGPVVASWSLREEVADSSSFTVMINVFCYWIQHSVKTFRENSITHQPISVLPHFSKGFNKGFNWPVCTEFRIYKIMLQNFPNEVSWLLLLSKTLTLYKVYLSAMFFSWIQHTIIRNVFLGIFSFKTSLLFFNLFSIQFLFQGKGLVLKLLKLNSSAIQSELPKKETHFFQTLATRKITQRSLNF